MFVRCKKCWFVFYSRPSEKTLEKFQQTPKPNWDLKFKMTSANWTNERFLVRLKLNKLFRSYVPWQVKPCSDCTVCIDEIMSKMQVHETVLYHRSPNIHQSFRFAQLTVYIKGFVQLKSLLIYMLWVLVSLLSLECWNFIIYTLLTLGENRHATVTLADKLIVTDIDVSRSGTWFPVPKYNGTNASQITHVVYMVKPVHFAVISRFFWLTCSPNMLNRFVTQSMEHHTNKWEKKQKWMSLIVADFFFKWKYF